MKITATTNKQKPEVEVEHNGAIVTFSANVFTQAAFRADFDVFDGINRYWASLPLSSQSTIWMIYKDIDRGFAQIFTSDELYTHLNEKIKELIVFHPLERLERFVAIDPTVNIPASVKEVFVESIDDNNTRGKTYTRLDYIQLVALALFMRTLLPIWGEYINSTRRDIGMDHKEYFALQLLTDTGVLESPAIVKLVTYINQITKEKHYNPEKILSGVSSEDMGFLLLALVCIRRLCTGDLRGKDEKTHPVSRVYKFLYQKVFGSSDDTTVKEKKFTPEGGDADKSKRSILESYRKRSQLSVGEIAELEFAFEDVYGVAMRMAPTITEEEIVSALLSSEKLHHERIGDPQILIMSWTLKTAISPRSAGYVSKMHLTAMLGVLEAVLWNWGHKYLAVLATSHMIIGQEEMNVAPIDSRGQIPPELQEEVAKFYPYTWSTVKRNNTQVIQEPNAALFAIDLVVDDLTNNAWRSTASEEKITEVFGEFRRKLPILSGIKSDLARLVIDIEKRRSLTPSSSAE